MLYCLLTARLPLPVFILEGEKTNQQHACPGSNIYVKRREFCRCASAQDQKLEENGSRHQASKKNKKHQEQQTDSQYFMFG